MKNIKTLFKNRFLVVLSIALIATSCDSWIDHDINIDPDAPSDVPMSLLLTPIQQSMGFNLVGNNSVRTTNIWMQQFDGTSRQSFTEARYQLTPADVNNLWSSIYIEMLNNASIIITKATTEGSESPNYAGVAQILQATTLGVTTDLYGDIPFSEALQGSTNVLSPVYDSQEAIYNTIFELLDKAVVNLNNTTNAFAISKDADVSYAGSTSKWKKAAYSIKARHLLQLSLKNGDAAYTAALAAVANGFASNADDFKVPFSSDDQNPIYQFMDDRADIRMGSTLVDMLAFANDPRLPFYAAKDKNGDYVGSMPGTQNEDASKPGTYIASEASPSYMMTYAELKFIEAECKFRLGQPGAQAAYEAAVTASVSRVAGASAANTTWLNDNIVGDPVTLEKIMTQKYINSFGTNQAYADWRRTGLPSLSVAAGAVIPGIPTRFPYPQDELDFNTDNVPSVTISDKLWWDN
jgi:hypothetical protein